VRELQHSWDLQGWVKLCILLQLALVVILRR